ncbi:bacillithiol system redox-active protein YtxJ [Polaribacter gochangensis]|uniref:bacillithiol system redox-active protein YtxJ n=1 Tax=Polaribacter gochangensis TaxID=3252903 RepID=UPI003904661B
MSFLKNIFTTNSEESKEKIKKSTPTVQWIPLTTIAQLDDLQKIAKQDTVLIFKHSTRCIISRMVLRQLEKVFDAKDVVVHLYFLDLLNYRDLSNEIAAKFQVPHQSPQLLVLKEGVLVGHASHYDILELEY